jgi:acetolactate synthase-1/3 small subunit
MPHILQATLDDEPGVLNRVTSLVRRRAFNIQALTVGPAESPGLSRMTLVVEADEAGARRVAAHLEKLLNVLKVELLTGKPAVVRYLALLRIAAPIATRGQVLLVAGAFRAQVVDVGEDSLVLECSGSAEKLAALSEALRPYGLLELCRTGALAMARGASPALGPKVQAEPDFPPLAMSV